MWSLLHIFWFLVAVACFKATQCKRAEFWQTKKVVLSCDRNGRVALVEHFFSVIFTEFRRNPPVCVCVQMCENQATYCYPNGCLLVKINEDTSSQTMQSSNPDYSDKPQLQLTSKEHPKASTGAAVSLQNVLVDNNMRSVSEKNMPNERKEIDFEDKYKRIFKSKMGHRGSLKYGAEEPKYVKNGYQGNSRNFEPLDMTKTHWPGAKQKEPELSTRNSVDLKEDAEKAVRKFFLPTFNDEPESEGLMSQNFKRSYDMIKDEENSIENMGSPAS